MPIGGVFADSKRLVVPIYQRTYEWTPERQIFPARRDQYRGERG
jgi:hypothetical protein